MPSIERGPLKRIVQTGAAGAIAVAGIFGGSPDGGRFLTQALNNLSPGRSARASESSQLHQVFFPSTLKDAPITGLSAQPNETPTPTPTWPEGDSNLLASLPLVAGVHLTIFKDPSQAPDWIVKYGAGYDPSKRNVLYLLPQGTPDDPNFTMAHELCHAHQHLSILKAGLGEPPGNLKTWENTPEGQAFATSADMVKTNGFLPWSNFGGNQVEDFAEICRHAYKPAKERLGWLRMWPALVDFTRKWLPGSAYS